MVTGWAIVITLFFGGFTTCFNFVSIIYILNTLRQRDRFEVRVRMPSVAILEIMQLQVRPGREGGHVETETPEAGGCAAPGEVGG